MFKVSFVNIVIDFFFIKNLDLLTMKKRWAEVIEPELAMMLIKLVIINHHWEVIIWSVEICTARA